jgi:hypothetical protein
MSESLPNQQLDLPFEERFAVYRDQGLGLIGKHGADACAQSAGENEDRN